MAKKGGRKANGTVTKKAASAPGAKIDKIENYEDTLEEGGVDDFMFKRDQIMFDDRAGSDDDDINGEEGEEVLGLDLTRGKQYEDEDEEEYYDEDEEKLPTKKDKKKKSKADLSTKGRFGKAIESSDEEDEEAGTSEEEDEGWGRQYYSRPSNRREKEDEDEYDETREEEREMEEREVKRLQKKAREAFAGAEDWGLEAGALDQPVSVVEKDEEVVPVVVPAPKTSDPSTLLRHLEANEPVKLALARDFPLTVYKLQRTAKGISKMMEEKEGEESLHKGLGWLHYQTLLTYATTLAYYIHLCALPLSERPDFNEHPILPRLLQLKEGVSMLEDLDFAAGSVSDVDPLADGKPVDDDEYELAELVKAKRELMARMMIASGSGQEVMDEEDDDEEIDYDEQADMDDLWQREGLDDDELADLLADAEADGDFPIEDEEEEVVAPSKKAKKEKKEKKEKAKKSKEKKEAKKAAPAFAPLEEPTFVASKKSGKEKRSAHADNDILGDPAALDDADATDKERRKRSLQFHTSKIASTSARRNAARNQRLGGDEDLPYRDRQAARDAALRKNSRGVEGEDLDGSEITEKDRKRAREIRDDVEEDAGDDEGYYDLVKRRKTEKQEAKDAAHDQFLEEKFAGFDDDSHEGGPRALTRAIEKNRGLTPRRSKTGRNPRVKKRLAYDKAKQKVGSQRAVYKGGESTYGGQYKGEKTGISQTIKSRKF